MSQKRKSDVSCSVAGANLRRKRRRIVGDDPVNPSTATDGEMKRTEVFEYFGNPEKLTLEQGQVVMERRLKELDLTLSPSQKVTPADGNCLFHLLLDQTRYIPDLNDFASNSTEFRTKIISLGCSDFIQNNNLSLSVILFRLSPIKQPKRGEGEEDHAAQRTSRRLMVPSEVEYVVVEDEFGDREDGDGVKDSRQMQTTQLFHCKLYCIQFLISESREMCPYFLQSSPASPLPALTPSYLVTTMIVNSSRTTSWRRTSIVNSSGITLMTHYDSFIT